MARRRRIAELTGAPPPTPGSVFGPDDDNVVPGEIVLALEADAAAEIATSIPTAPDRGTLAASVTAFGHTALDKALARLDVQEVARVHGPSPTDVVDGIATASDLGLDGTFRVRYAGSEAPAAAAKRLGALGEVAWAEPNRFREASVVPNDPQYPSQWGLPRIECPAAWDRTTGTPSVVVAVVDTGTDLNHPDLAGLLVPGQDLVDFAPGSVPKPGWVFEGDFTGVDATPQDEVGHGTHVTGTICCRSNNGVGVAGVTWNTRVMPVRVLARIRETATGRVSGSGSSANIAAGIRWAVDHGARVINMSLGGYGDAIVEREAVAYAISHGVVVVAAMANDNVATPSFPAAYPGVIAVGATDSADHRASFSNFGPHISVAGPGVGIQSTYWDDTYASLSGTSMASPHVAGVAALILSVAPSLTGAQVGNIIRSTAKPLRDAPGDPVPNDRYGHGLVQAAAAVNAAAPPVKSKQLFCQHSLLVSCTQTLLTCPSVVTCPTKPPVCHVNSVQIVCQQSIFSCPSRAFCPTHSPLCVASGTPGCVPHVSLADCPSLPCPRSLACGSIACGPGHGGFPGRPGAGGAEWEEYDPHGYDPYGGDYE